MKHSRFVLRMLAIGALLSATLHASAADQTSTNDASGEVLLTGSLGRLVRVPTNDVPPGLLPPANMGLNAQIPNPSRGTKIPEVVQRRTEENRARQDTFEFFPAAQPQLMPYLAAQDEYGNTAFRPNPLTRSGPQLRLRSQKPNTEIYAKIKTSPPPRPSGASGHCPRSAGLRPDRYGRARRNAPDRSSALGNASRVGGSVGMRPADLRDDSALEKSKVAL